MAHHWGVRMKSKGENRCPHHLRQLRHGGVGLDPARGHLQPSWMEVLFYNDHHLLLLGGEKRRQNTPGHPILKPGKIWASLKKLHDDRPLGNRERAKHFPLLERPPQRIFCPHRSSTRPATMVFSLTTTLSRVEARQWKRSIILALEQ
ncbi:sister chromatid separation protein [Histoplasma capsulatum]|uniref:Sister chromatid separation protein n=1 Tax=Ajellomyces capsulatus TaxID=5037 RepID=A0A8A1MA33_AJECA|nr:sister chromatid separation protein [Histoplasma capsulatum]